MVNKHVLDLGIPNQVQYVRLSPKTSVTRFARSSMKRLEQSVRGSVHPSLIHVHRHELMQQWRVFGCAAARVVGHHVVGRVNMETVLSRDATSDGRLACTTAAADPVNVLELFLKRSRSPQTLRRLHTRSKIRPLKTEITGSHPAYTLPVLNLQQGVSQ